MPHTRRHFHCRLSSDTVLLLLAMGQMAVLQRTINQNHAEALRGREAILAMETHNEWMIVEHMKRTVERWESLKTANPSLNVKEVPEPILTSP